MVVPFIKFKTVCTWYHGININCNFFRLWVL